MSAKHTPGPWKAHFEEAYFVTGPDLGRVAMMMNLKGAHGLGGRRSGAESAANCRLIAAAPDMLEALLDARQCIHLDRVALADAHTGPDWLDEDGALAVGDYDAVLARIEAAIAKATGERE